MVERFRLESDKSGAYVVSDKNGDFVKYEDYQNAAEQLRLANIDNCNLEAEIDNLNSGLTAAHDAIDGRL